MSIRLTDADISDLIAQTKVLPEDYVDKIELRSKRGHKEREFEVQGGSGDKFHIILRESTYNALDFSVILGYSLPGLNTIFRLRRYNGKSHEHTNLIELDKFYDFHVHYATARYQELGSEEEAYARPADSYSNIEEALQVMFAECGFIMPSNPQMRLF